jgi:hypothetical protein
LRLEPRIPLLLPLVPEIKAALLVLLYPGGTRKITVDDGTIGVFRQAWIDGGGGEGEPAAYTLPALVKGDRIIADFSVPPKSAPPTYAAFKGKRTEQGIEWEDGNVWPCGGHKHQD